MPRSLSRRDLLIGGAVLGVTVVAAACQQVPDTKPEVDDLQAQIDLAVRDAASATAAASANTQLAPTLNAIAGIRSAHVAALTKELKRIPGADATVRSTTSTTTTAPAAPPPVDQVKDQLKDSAHAAMDLATKQSGYRAGLLASISAACASAAEVDLP
ncbi:hypothetical protein [Mycobacteroides franklinii]|uniref:Tat pathway signal protein n=1 Tax=Mycobacteroides franklinii TaxID=948102 RepID=A0A4R8R332_9MYCO|nr:hypothetical protein [Mycobacteroides franklinii]TDZ45850.1 hypothetical protein CCUG64054_01500 [Mycobacteroides franklinii]TDZ49340.1 hypothetical protein CCUG63697_03876 [Mycobacteroides franklinii]TDZ59520.1 hypothetical protein CCUG63696_01502 [Mycobacteroides franklinii]TDZ67035.1 hypothetical protein CCUG63695_00865 [Mycobacteroides franklinii]TDZ72959.1 hypothetical protein CCUG64056_01500 [Mycobacteroides franklinii]